MREFLGNICGRGTVTLQQRLIPGNDKSPAGIAGLENLRAEVLKHSLHFMRMANERIAFALLGGGAKQQDAAADQQNHGDGEGRPCNTSQREGHQATTTAATAWSALA